MFGSSKQAQPTLDLSNTVCVYGNDTQVDGGDHEVGFYFSVRSPGGAEASGQVPVQQVFMTWFTAKRLLMALNMSVQRHEQVLGGIPNQSPSERMVEADHPARATCANFVRVTGSTEELIIDFGVNPQPLTPGEGDPTIIHTQLVLMFPTAKALARQLGDVIRAYEARHGELELDVRKRVRR